MKPPFSYGFPMVFLWPSLHVIPGLGGAQRFWSPWRPLPSSTWERRLRPATSLKIRWSFFRPKKIKTEFTLWFHQPHGWLEDIIIYLWVIFLMKAPISSGFPVATFWVPEGMEIPEPIMFFSNICSCFSLRMGGSYSFELLNSDVACPTIVCPVSMGYTHFI